MAIPRSRKRSRSATEAFSARSPPGVKSDATPSTPCCFSGGVSAPASSVDAPGSGRPSGTPGTAAAHSSRIRCRPRDATVPDRPSTTTRCWPRPPSTSRSRIVFHASRRLPPNGPPPMRSLTASPNSASRSWWAGARFRSDGRSNDSSNSHADFHRRSKTSCCSAVPMNASCSRPSPAMPPEAKVRR